MRKSLPLLLAGIMAAFLLGCAHPRYDAKLASVPPPDRGLFDSAMRHMAKKDYDPAISMLHTLINSYPESPYAERARGALEDCWRLPECALIAAQLEPQIAKGYKETAIFFEAPATGTSENLCNPIATLEIRLDTPELVILQVFQPTIAKEGIKKPAEATATACDPDRTCDRDLKARVQFKRLNRKGAFGAYVIERSDGRRQAGSFNVRAKPLNICE